MQYQVRTGPIQNDPAPFAPPMADGSVPTRNRELLGSRIPLPIAQTSPEVTATSSMYAGRYPDRNRELLGARIPLPIAQPAGATATSSMTAGWYPDRNRELLGARIPLPITQPDGATFISSMTAGWYPDRNRELLGARIPLPLAQPTTEVTDTSSMYVGWYPDRNRELLASRIPLPIAQTTHDQAPISVEMFAGWQPTRPILPWVTNTGWAIIVPPDPVPFLGGILEGGHPDRNRELLGARIPLPIAQPTHVQALLSVEMFAGWQPARPILLWVTQTGWAITQQPLAAPFASGMLEGSGPPARNRELLGARIPLPLAQPTAAVTTTSSMYAGWTPWRNREVLGARIPLPLAQPTPEPTTTSAMYAGWTPGRNRELLGAKIPLPLGQTTPVAAPFSIEMALGWTPTSPRLPFRALVHIGGFGIPLPIAGPNLFNPAWADGINLLIGFDQITFGKGAGVGLAPQSFDPTAFDTAFSI